MDSDQFDSLAARLSPHLTRRRSLGVLGVIGIGSVTSAEQTDAKKKKKKKKKCKRGTKKCGKKCIASTSCCSACGACESCQGGACTSNCQAGDICVQNECVTGQGSCAAGADSCAAEAILCGGDTCVCYATMGGQTRCGSFDGLSECGTCATDDDCASLFPAVPGVFCARSTTALCGCLDVVGFCGAPCQA